MPYIYISLDFLLLNGSLCLASFGNWDLGLEELKITGDNALLQLHEDQHSHEPSP